MHGKAAESKYALGAIDAAEVRCDTPCMTDLETKNAPFETFLWQVTILETEGNGC